MEYSELIEIYGSMNYKRKFGYNISKLEESLIHLTLL